MDLKHAQFNIGDDVYTHAHHGFHKGKIKAVFLTENGFMYSVELDNFIPNRGPDFKEFSEEVLRLVPPF